VRSTVAASPAGEVASNVRGTPSTVAVSRCESELAGNVTFSVPDVDDGPLFPLVMISRGLATLRPKKLKVLPERVIRFKRTLPRGADVSGGTTWNPISPETGIVVVVGPTETVRRDAALSTTAR
jgi:hypothetical protein